MNKREALELVAKDGRALSKLSEQFRDDERIVKTALWSANSQPIFHFASQRLKSNYEMALEAIKSSVKNFNSVAKEIKESKEFALVVALMDGSVFNDFTLSLKKDKDIILASIALSPHALSYAPKEVFNDFDYIKSLLIKNANCLEYCSDDIKHNIELVNIALTQSKQSTIYPLKYASLAVKDNKEFMLSILHSTVIKDNFKLLSFVSKRLKDDVDMVLQASEIYLSSLMYASDRIKEIVGHDNQIEKLKVLYEKETLDSTILTHNSQKRIKI